MKIKLDENIPVGLIKVLGDLGHDTDSVQGEGLEGEPDNVVWTAAQEAERFFSTQDLDFSDIRTYRPGQHHGVLLVRLREPGRKALLEYIGDLFRQEDMDAMAGCFLTLSERKVRIRRPAELPVHFSRRQD